MPSNWLGPNYLAQARFSEAVNALEKARSFIGEDDQDEFALQIHAYARWGKTNEAKKHLEELKERSTHRWVSPYSFATAHAGFGDAEKVFEFLEAAYKEQDAFLPELATWAMWDPFRSDPRFTSWPYYPKIQPSDHAGEVTTSQVHSAHD
jgi:tetratricopeptide (TPR) repeat protein